MQQLKIKHNGVLGYFIEVAQAHADKLLADKENFRHRQTMAGAVRFSTDELASLAQDAVSGQVRLDVTETTMDWFDLRNMLTVARAVTQAAQSRTESRGAHQREDFPEMLPQWRVNQVIRLQDRDLAIAQVPATGALPPANAVLDCLLAHRSVRAYLHEPPGWREPHGIRQEIPDDLLQSMFISVHRVLNIGKVRFDTNVFGFR